MARLCLVPVVLHIWSLDCAAGPQALVYSHALLFFLLRSFWSSLSMLSQCNLLPGWICLSLRWLSWDMEFNVVINPTSTSLGIQGLLRTFALVLIWHHHDVVPIAYCRKWCMKRLLSTPSTYLSAWLFTNPNVLLLMNFFKWSFKRKNPKILSPSPLSLIPLPHLCLFLVYLLCTHFIFSVPAFYRWLKKNAQGVLSDFQRTPWALCFKINHRRLGL